MCFPESGSQDLFLPAKKGLLKTNNNNKKQIAQKGGGCPIPGDTQGQAGQGSEQPDLVVGVLIPRRGVGLDDL